MRGFADEALLCIFSFGALHDSLFSSFTKGAMLQDRRSYKKSKNKSRKENQQENFSSDYSDNLLLEM